MTILAAVIACAAAILALAVIVGKALARADADRGTVIDLTAQRRLRALGSAVEGSKSRHPSGKGKDVTP
jgi:hypothetical protein